MLFTNSLAYFVSFYLFTIILIILCRIWINTIFWMTSTNKKNSSLGFKNFIMQQNENADILSLNFVGSPENKTWGLSLCRSLFSCIQPESQSHMSLQSETLSRIYMDAKTLAVQLQGSSVCLCLQRKLSAAVQTQALGSYQFISKDQDLQRHQRCSNLSPYGQMPYHMCIVPFHSP